MRHVTLSGKISLSINQSHLAHIDWFDRSGAVEQLRVHVRNLGMLNASGIDVKGSVELFERGYGKDAAGIAKEAISYGMKSMPSICGY